MVGRPEHKVACLLISLLNRERVARSAEFGMIVTFLIEHEDIEIGGDAMEKVECVIPLEEEIIGQSG